MTQPSLLGSVAEQTPQAASGHEMTTSHMYDRRVDSTPLRILALDLSLRATGFATSWSLTRVQASGILTPRKLTGTARLILLRDMVRSMAREQRADLVIIEGISFGSTGAMHAEICGLNYLVRVALEEIGIPWTEVPPSTLKKFATGKGNAQKADMLAAAIRRLNYQGSDHNEADALWLMQMALQYYGCAGAVSLPAANLESLAKVTWPQLKRRAA